jgi:addiction module RelB/DinJ family antitoxin
MTKDATVSARIDENIKSQAESILQQLGIPVSVVINTLYHQIIIQQGVPFPLTLAKAPPTLDGMTKAQLDAKLEHSYQQVIARQGRSLKDVMADLERKHA